MYERKRNAIAYYYEISFMVKSFLGRPQSCSTPRPWTLTCRRWPSWPTGCFASMKCQKHHQEAKRKSIRCRDHRPHWRHTHEAVLAKSCKDCRARQMVSTKAQELEAAKQILSEVFHIRPVDVDLILGGGILWLSFLQDIDKG